MLYPEVHRRLPLPDSVKNDLTYTKVVTSIAVSIPQKDLVDFYTNYFKENGFYGANPTWYEKTKYSVYYKRNEHDDGVFVDDMRMEIEAIKNGNSRISFIIYK